MITLFRNENRFLSNFYGAPIVYRGVKYRSSECAYQAAKFAHLTPDVIRTSVSQSIIDEYHIDLTDNQCIEHLFANLSSAEAKKLSHKLPRCPEWDTVKVDIMREIIYEKFSHNAYLKRRLLATKNEPLIEGNWWHDNFWGECTCDKCKHIAKKNMLGVILMETRDRLK